MAMKVFFILAVIRKRRKHVNSNSSNGLRKKPSPTSLRLKNNQSSGGANRARWSYIKNGAYETKVHMIKELHNDGVPLTSIIKASGLTKGKVEKILQITPA